MFPARTAVLTVGHQATREQCGANGVIVVVDVVAVVVDGAVVVDICRVVRIVTGRPQPPPVESGIIESPDQAVGSRFLRLQSLSVAVDPRPEQVLAIRTLTRYLLVLLGQNTVLLTS